MKFKMVKFLRRDARRFVKFSKGRGRKAKYRKPTGRDNKMREKKAGYPPIVSIGYRKEKDKRGQIHDKAPVLVYNESELGGLEKNQIAILGRVGRKKRVEILRKALELGVTFANANPKSYLKKIEKNTKKNVEENKK